MSNFTMELPWSSSQHEIKFEIKEEVIDLHDEMEYSCDDSLCGRGGDDSISKVNNLEISYTKESSSHEAELKDMLDDSCHPAVIENIMSSSSKRRKQSPAVQCCNSTASESTGLLKPTPSQLRALWELDNKCANKYMGMPLRQCSSTEAPDQPGAVPLPVVIMSILERQIKDMWRKLSTVLEIYRDNDNPDLGYRLRVKPDLPIKLVFKPADQIMFGWKAVFSDIGPSSHLYLRSNLKEHNQYLGGPVSYCNWVLSKDATITVRQISHGSARHLVRVESKSLSAGSELLWDYGEKIQPVFSNEGWFVPKCCSILASLPKNVCIVKKNTLEVFRELCVLCGKPYRAARRDWTTRKSQKKVHFLNDHVNFLGTDWDGHELYDPSAYSVDYKRALIAAERLNKFIQRLESDSWHVVPACVVISMDERDNLDADSTMQLFVERSKFLRRLGSIVVRGHMIPSVVEHLDPIRPSPWHVIFTRDNKPKRTYSLSKEEKEALTAEIIDASLQDVMMVLNINEMESDETS
ncbi:uncharacterized protein LOC113211305 isoform X1 [Frankliniella occidentalis]|uniref:Uncharacterized protein LOC113211305 isoform X1 n=1 Tax=Frankliniella occidentalis TaxID=133901 RepID=A0A6J1T445_FRAOC|nr:uncharacterized protein LOC113211305 isoform X1 [Frankliniella occidentalis]XP_026285422.1 uncharacterized protein LOC113211305 isoform X1 [Frankliniella occidentalis]